ncbi:response regulator transcription factor [Mucilaginibacter ginkgonis]|uniref:Response regulator transcription factor n=1 Tax=Mucilaginibacter ginkgonis TaxID=2682091 RepID=A0A6I4HY81_9SPHI|nr:response regulator [Mucilaginibacter ginkgonis]QQL49455.1 response regulator transcription factor [Mucilaginibacter ginkgonis]
MKKRILVIDDDPGILDALQIMLESDNYEVRPLGRADKIFEEIDAFEPDLILMDVMLAGVDGRNVCKALKAEGKYSLIPTILISANINAYSIMFEKGAPNDFVSKPFDMEDLLHRIEVQLAA